MTTEAGTTTKRKSASRKPKATARSKSPTAKASKASKASTPRAKAARKTVKPKGFAWRHQIETMLAPVRRIFGQEPVSVDVWNETMKVKMADARKLIAKTRKLINTYTEATEEKAKVLAKELTKESSKEGHAST